MRFGKVYRLVFGPAGKKGLEISSPLRITFDTEKDLKEEPNVTRISVWNLKKETRDFLTAPDTFVVLYAGYEKEGGPLLLASGNVVNGYSYKEGADVITEVEVMDGFVNLRDSAISVGYESNVSAKKVLEDCAAKLGLTLFMPNGAPDRTWANGLSFYGPVHELLHKVVTGTGLEWSIQNNVLQVIQRNGLTQRRAIVLCPGSGMIGRPERTKQGAKEKALVRDKRTGNNKDITSSEQQKEGWRVRSMLLPQALPGDVVQLKSAFVEGFYRIETAKSRGDSYGSGEWVTELQLVDAGSYEQHKKEQKEKEQKAAAAKAKKEAKK